MSAASASACEVFMRALTLTAVVRADHTLTVQVPEDIPPGTHEIVVVFSGGPTAGQVVPFTVNWPVHDVGPWPEGLTFRREDIYGDDGR
jgi:hypothetical protein